MAHLTEDEKRLLCDEALSHLEIQELKFIQWGFFNGFLQEETLFDTLRHYFQEKVDAELRELWERAQAEGFGITQILENLKRRKLVFKSKKTRYRTRFSEAVRNMFFLRQRFNTEDWQTAMPLVSDLRVYLSRRSYPRRDVTQETLAARLTLSQRQRDVLHALLTTDQPIVLAAFQARATEAILNGLQRQEPHAVMIGAGTGAGKTKAFYLPALLHVSEQLEVEGVKAIAIYPRNELLKDQLAEAYREARKLDSVLPRPLRLAAYFGDVPHTADSLKSGYHGKIWDKSSEHLGWLCPFFNCPKCGGRMVWTEKDVNKEKKAQTGEYARLTCTQCRHVVTDNTLLLTRQQQRVTLPDIVFTTTEMLNRHLSDSSEYALFGLGVVAAPSLVLMDEVHLNAGFYGAQISYLLRRWQFMRQQKAQTPLCIVGLSATLRDAVPFFARLTGVPEARVSYIEPQSNEMVSRSMSYNVALRHQVYSAPLLTTSAYVTMLIGRVLDPLPDHIAPSEGAYGRRLFAFSDKLDIVNRWYHILSDIESPKKNYSQYMLVGQGVSDEEKRERFNSGQYWHFFKEVGHNLEMNLNVGLTSSQYRGVDPTASIIIATSTLEVGFNDPLVGAIIQHGTPFSQASFVQRKGRAGRSPTMRTWTVLVTGGYGRDRWVFQNAEFAFSSLLPPLSLPLNNLYVLKIQAAYTLMDWLAWQAWSRYGISGNVWKLFTNKGVKFSDDHISPELKQTLLKLLRELINDPKPFLQVLRETLHIESDLLEQSVLWAQPRPFMLSLLPTLLRQLETEWQVANFDAERDEWVFVARADAVSNTPLPEYLPQALFEELNNIQTQIRIPPLKKHEEARLEGLPVSLALREFTPFRVNKRYANKNDIKSAHWLNVKETPPNSRLPVNLLNATFQMVDEISVNEGDATKTYSILMPVALNLTNKPSHISDRSYARYLWQSILRPYHYLARSHQAKGIPIRLSASLRAFLPEVMLYTHAQGECAKVTRYATELESHLVIEKGEIYDKTYTLVATPDNDAPVVGIGFSLHADALCWSYTPLDVESLRQRQDWREHYRYIAPLFFRYLVRKNRKLGHEREQYAEVVFNKLVEQSMQNQLGLDANALEIGKWDWETVKAAVEKTSRDEEEQETTDEDTVLLSISEENWRQFLANISQDIVVLWRDDHPELAVFLQQLYADSLGSVLFSALEAMHDDMQSDALMLDIQPNAIWISETTGGGMGLIQKLADALSAQPLKFEMTFLKAMYHCPRQMLAQHLFRIASAVRDDLALQQTFANLRLEADLPTMTHIEKLRDVLATHGIVLEPTLGITLNSKFLRPHSSGQTDMMLSALAQRWLREEARLGIEIPLSSFCYALAKDPTTVQEFGDTLAQLGAPLDDPKRLEALLAALLWTRCENSCPDCLEHTQLFMTFQPLASRRILQLVCSDPLSQAIALDESDTWHTQVVDTLRTRFDALLVCPHTELDHVLVRLQPLLAEIIEVHGTLQCRAEIQNIQYVGNNAYLRLSLSEFGDRKVE